jgi:DNA mismatch repair ATPase MutS
MIKRMHTGDEVYVTRTGKFYHHFDDDCPTTSRILKGKTSAKKVKEEEAIKMGYTLCKHCSKEYAEDLAERKGCGAAAFFFLTTGISASFILLFFGT